MSIEGEGLKVVGGAAVKAAEKGGISSLVKKLLGGGAAGAGVVGGASLLNSMLGAGSSTQGVAGGDGGGMGAGAGRTAPGGSYSPPASAQDIANQAMKISNPTLVTISTQLDKLLNLTAKTNSSLGEMSSLTRYNMDRQAKIERETRLEAPATPVGQPPQAGGQAQQSGSGLGTLLAGLVGAGVAAGLANYYGGSTEPEPTENTDGSHAAPSPTPRRTTPPPPASDATPDGNPPPANDQPRHIPGPFETLWNAGKSAWERYAPESMGGKPAAPQSQHTAQGQTGGFVSPVPSGSNITSGVGWRPSTGSYHNGVDIPLPMDTPVKAAGSGTVVQANWHSGYGRTVVVWHGGPKKIASLYGHLNSISVRPGQKVNSGQVIGKSGSSGTRSTGPHLHFEIRENFDPTPDSRGHIGLSRSNGVGVDPGRYVPNIPKDAGRNRGGVKKVASADATPVSPDATRTGGMQLASLSTSPAQDTSLLHAPPGQDPTDFSDVAARNNNTPIGGVDLDPSHYDNLGPSGQIDEQSRLKPEYTQLGRNMQAAMAPAAVTPMLRNAQAVQVPAPAPATVPPKVTPYTPPTPGGPMPNIPTPANDVPPKIGVPANDNEYIEEVKKLWKKRRSIEEFFELVKKLLKYLSHAKKVAIIVAALAALGVAASWVKGWIEQYLPNEEPAPAPTPVVPTTPGAAPQPEIAPNEQPDQAQAREPAKPQEPFSFRLPIPWFDERKKRKDQFRPTPGRTDGGGPAPGSPESYRQFNTGQTAGLTFKLNEIDADPAVSVGAWRGRGALGLGRKQPLRGVIAEPLTRGGEPKPTPKPEAAKPAEQQATAVSAPMDTMPVAPPVEAAKPEEMPTKPEKKMPEPFKKAFKAAREKAKGPDGWFTWNEHKYQTNLANERVQPISKLRNVDVQASKEQSAPPPTPSSSDTKQSTPNEKQAQPVAAPEDKAQSTTPPAATSNANSTTPQATLAPKQATKESTPQNKAATIQKSEDEKAKAVINMSKKPPQAVTGNSQSNPAAQQRGNKVQQQSSPPQGASGGKGASSSEVPEPGAGEKLREYQLAFNSTYAIEAAF